MMIELNLIPNVPGIYFLWDKNGKILYIGKACNLRQRITHHSKLHSDFLPLLSAVDKIESLNDEELWRLNWNIVWRMTEQPIDVIFNEVNEITYKLVDRKELSKIEKEYIEKMSPPFNWDTSTKRYFDEQERLSNAIAKLNDEMFYREHHIHLGEHRARLLSKAIR